METIYVWLFVFLLFLIIFLPIFLLWGGVTWFEEKWQHRVWKKQNEKNKMWEEKFKKIGYSSGYLYPYHEKSDKFLNELYEKEKKKRGKMKKENLGKEKETKKRKVDWEKTQYISMKAHLKELEEEQKLKKIDELLNDISLQKESYNSLLAKLDVISICNTWLYEYNWDYFFSINKLIHGWDITYSQLIIDTLDNIMDTEVFSIDTFFDKINNGYLSNSVFLNILKENNNLKDKVKKIDDEIWYVKKLSREIKSKMTKLVDKYNQWIKQIETWYNSWEKKYIEKFFGLMIETNNYDYFFSKEFEIEYSEENKVLIIDYAFPDIENFPKLKEIKILKSWVEKEVFFSQKALKDIYEKYLYSICIRVIYEVFVGDIEGHVDMVSFNWFINTVNKATGHDETFYIMSLQVNRNEVIDIKLDLVDPKITFKTLKWICAVKLSSLTPIRPILSISREDKRFVDGYNIIEWIDAKTNLAAMDWQDFENLIRDLFERVYSKNDWEVKVTQASKDGGIDAIAFDPDPITWGKVVIQAKRYTNVVWVSAVRDLYWTVMNEWAMKGILVTTSNFWSDSYSFVKNKPISLIDWSNLLYLLQEHWYNAKIDIKEAKKILNQ